MRLSEYASTQRTYGSRKVPRSVQQSIPIDRIYEDGTWRCGNVYSQMWSMPDINFTMSDIRSDGAKLGSYLDTWADHIDDSLKASKVESTDEIYGIFNILILLKNRY